MNIEALKTRLNNLSYLEKYKLCIHLFKVIDSDGYLALTSPLFKGIGLHWLVSRYRKESCSSWHRHHIKPKCLYPELCDDKDNIVSVPPIVHWALHHWLYCYYLFETSNSDAVDRLSYSTLEQYINDQLKRRGSDLVFDFNEHDEYHLADEVFALVRNCIIGMSLYKYGKRLDEAIKLRYSLSERRKLKLDIKPRFPIKCFENLIKADLMLLKAHGINECSKDDLDTSCSDIDDILSKVIGPSKSLRTEA